MYHKPTNVNVLLLAAVRFDGFDAQGNAILMERSGIRETIIGHLMVAEQPNWLPAPALDELHVQSQRERVKTFVATEKAHNRFVFLDEYIHRLRTVPAGKWMCHVREVVKDGHVRARTGIRLLCEAEFTALIRAQSQFNAKARANRFDQVFGTEEA